MSDMSDPTTLPDEARDRRLDTLINGAIPYTLSHSWREDIGSLLGERDTLAAELDGLRAQIEKIRKATSDHKLADGEPSECADFGEGLDRGASIKSQAIRRILAQSPRGTVARIQADALEAAATAWGEDPDSWGDNPRDYRNELRDRAAAIRAATNPFASSGDTTNGAPVDPQ